MTLFPCTIMHKYKSCLSMYRCLPRFAYKMSCSKTTQMPPLFLVHFTIIQIHYYSNSNMRIWVFSTLWLILFSIASSTKVKPYGHTHPSRSFWYYLDPISYLSKSCLSSSPISFIQIQPQTYLFLLTYVELFSLQMSWLSNSILHKALSIAQV
jgi:hypothetical protein